MISTRAVFRLVAVVATVVAATMAPVVPSTAAAGDAPVLTQDDRIVDLPPVARVLRPDGISVDASADPFLEDPNGVVPLASFMERYSLDQDVWEVWRCDVPGNVLTLSHAEILDILAGTTVFYDGLSNGAYDPVFVTGGDVTATSTGACRDQVAAASGHRADAEGAFIVTDDGLAGFGGPGYECGTASQCASTPATYPDNARAVVVGGQTLRSFPLVAAHELGHALHWPHSSSGGSNDYDNYSDLMSGNRKANGASNPEPYATLGINRYRSGWIDPADLIVHTSGDRTLELVPYDRAGTQVVVIPIDLPTRFVTLDARRSRGVDAIPPNGTTGVDWEGIEVHTVDQSCSSGFWSLCGGLDATQTQLPADPGGDAHVLQPGESATIEGFTITVTAATADGYVVEIDDPAVGNEPVGTPPCPSGVTCDTVALVDAGGRWSVLDALDSPVTSNDFYYGNPGDVAFMGDWNGDGTATPGLYRQSDGFVYLRNSNTQGVADITFYFGNPGDVPLVGDFDGDGDDTVAIYRPAEGRVFIIDELGQDGGGLGAASFDFYFGNPGDVPFVGDFDGDGIDTVGLYRVSTGFVYFRNSLTSGVAELEFYYGDPGDVILAGDWDGDGDDTVAVYRPSTGSVYVNLENAPGTADYTLPVGTVPVAVSAGRR